MRMQNCLFPYTQKKTIVRNVYFFPPKIFQLIFCCNEKYDREKKINKLTILCAKSKLQLKMVYRFDDDDVDDIIASSIN